MFSIWPLMCRARWRRAFSNTTIPGIENAIWAGTTGQAESNIGSAVLLQYLDSGLTKTVFVGFPSATSTATSSVRQKCRFKSTFCRTISSRSPRRPTAGAWRICSAPKTVQTGYIAKNNGTASRVLFTLPLSQVTLSWPSPNVLLVVSKPDAASPGIAFSVSTKSGAVSQLLFAQGLSAIADAAFSTIIYQTTNGSRQTYTHSIATGKDQALSHQPIPEMRVEPTASSTLLCAAPITAVPDNFSTSGIRAAD